MDHYQDSEGVVSFSVDDRGPDTVSMEVQVGSGTERTDAGNALTGEEAMDMMDLQRLAQVANRTYNEINSAITNQLTSLTSQQNEGAQEGSPEVAEALDLTIGIAEEMMDGGQTTSTPRRDLAVSNPRRLARSVHFASMDAGEIPEVPKAVGGARPKTLPIPSRGQAAGAETPSVGPIRTRPRYLWRSQEYGIQGPRVQTPGYGLQTVSRGDHAYARNSFAPSPGDDDLPRGGAQREGVLPGPGSEGRGGAAPGGWSYPPSYVPAVDPEGARPYNHPSATGNPSRGPPGLSYSINQFPFDYIPIREHDGSLSYAQLGAHGDVVQSAVSHPPNSVPIIDHDGSRSYLHPSTPGKPPRYQKKVTKYDGKSSWLDYMRQFEIISALNGWNKEQMAMELATSLEGCARDVLTNLSMGDCLDYDALQEALRLRFEPRGQFEVYEAELRAKRRRRNETIPELLQDVKRMAKRAYPTADDKTLQQLTKSAFITSLDNDRQELFVKGMQPETVDHAAQAAMSFESHLTSRGKVAKEFVRSQTVAEVGREEMAAVNTAPASTTDVSGLIEKLEQLLLQMTRPARPRNLDKVQCWTCKEFGHYQNKCPNKKSPNATPESGNGQ